MWTARCHSREDILWILPNAWQLSTDQCLEQRCPPMPPSQACIDARGDACDFQPHRHVALLPQAAKARAGACPQLQTPPSVARMPPPTPLPPALAASRSKVFKGPAALATCEGQPGPHRCRTAVIRVGFDTPLRTSSSGRTCRRLLSACSAGRRRIRNASHSATMERRLMAAAVDTGTTIDLTWAGLVGELRGV